MLVARSMLYTWLGHLTTLVCACQAHHVYVLVIRAAVLVLYLYRYKACTSETSAGHYAPFCRFNENPDPLAANFYNRF